MSELNSNGLKISENSYSHLHNHVLLLIINVLTSIGNLFYLISFYMLGGGQLAYNLFLNQKVYHF